jgi:hypothetical protein
LIFYWFGHDFLVVVVTSWTTITLCLSTKPSLVCMAMVCMCSNADVSNSSFNIVWTWYNQIPHDGYHFFNN